MFQLPLLLLSILFLRLFIWIFVQVISLILPNALMNYLGLLLLLLIWMNPGSSISLIFNLLKVVLILITAFWLINISIITHKSIISLLHQLDILRPNVILRRIRPSKMNRVFLILFIPKARYHLDILIFFCIYSDS